MLSMKVKSPSVNQRGTVIKSVVYLVVVFVQGKRSTDCADTVIMYVCIYVSIRPEER